MHDELLYFTMAFCLLGIVALTSFGYVLTVMEHQELKATYEALKEEYTPCPPEVTFIDRPLDDYDAACYAI